MLGILILEFMKDEQEDKLLKASFIKSPILAFSIALLVIIVGIISFIYSNGFETIKNNWINLVTPSFSLALEYDTPFIPADGQSQLLVNIIAKNKKDQLISGEEIKTTIIEGEVNWTVSNNTPADVSKQIIITASEKVEKVIISFALNGKNKLLNLEIFDPILPPSPILTGPKADVTFSTSNPIISGQNPVGTRVEIYIDSIINTVAETGDSGLFSLPLEKPIGNGTHTLYIKTINKYGIRSNPSNSVNINIKTPDPEIDLNNIRIKPNPVTSNEIFYIFIPTSADTQEVIVMLEDTKWPLTDKYRSSIFSGIVKSPKNPGLYRLSAIVTNGGGDSILANNIASVIVE